MSTLEGGLAFAFGLGFVAYLMFKRYEPNDLLSLIVLLGLLPAIPAAVLRPALQSTAHSVLFSYAVHLSTLLASLVASRIASRRGIRLQSTPGPWQASKALAGIRDFAWEAYGAIRGVAKSVR